MIIHHTQPFSADIRKSCNIKITFFDVPLNAKKSSKEVKTKSTTSNSALDSALSISTTPLRIFFAFMTCVVLFSLLSIWIEVFTIDDIVIRYCQNAVAVIAICILLEIECAAPISYIWNTILVWASGYFTWIMVQIIFNSYFDSAVEQHYISVCAAVFLTTLLFVLTGRLRLSAIISASFWFLLTIANYFVFSFRGELLFAADLLSIGTAMDVSSGYTYYISGNIIEGFIIYAALIAIACMMSIRTNKPLISFRIRIVTGVLCILTCIWFLNNDSLGDYYYSWTPEANDYIYSFTYNIKMLNITKPDGYSTEKVESTLSEQESISVSGGQKPVVIAIMNESFSDPSVVGSFSTDKPYLSYFNSLTENTIKGYVYTEVFGAGTCDSEYAFISGNSTAFAATNAMPYQLYLTGTTPNLATVMNDQGYASHAMHPGDVTSWNRNNAYKYLGFKDFQSQDSFLNGEIDAEACHGYISDLSTYRKIISMYENRGNELPFYFDVTIANHAGYDVMTSDLDPVHITDLEGTYPNAEVFLSLMRRSDTELRQLIEYFKRESTPVIICFFGDHQANIETEFYEEIAGKPMSEWTDEELQSRYCTPFFIWANYDIPEQSGLNIGIYNLSSLLLQTAELDMSNFNYYLLKTAQTLPVISTKGIIDSKGDYYSFKDPGKYSDILTQFQYINYNNLFDSKKRLNQYYFLPDSIYLDENNKIKKRDEPYYIDGKETK